jgi:hypothetical protein
MIGRIPNMRVEQGRGSCPTIALRGHGGFRGSSPQIYVDGTRVGDSCLLERLRVREVRRVEVYPTGVTQRPGYTPNASGLILVFLTGPEIQRR